MSKGSGYRYTYQVTDLKTGAEHKNITLDDIAAMTGAAVKTVQTWYRYYGNSFVKDNLLLERTPRPTKQPKPPTEGGVTRKKLAVYKGEELVGEYMAGDVMDFLACGEGPIRRALDRGGHTTWGYYLEPRDDVKIRLSRRCKRCGARFVNRMATEYCQKCRQENRAEGIKRRKAAEAERRPQGIPVKKKSELSRIAFEAGQHGMSYGQYVGRGL